MGHEVEQREEDGEGLLHAEKTNERPFSMVLHDGLRHGRVAGLAEVGDYVLAGVVAFGRTCPLKETQVDG